MQCFYHQKLGRDRLMSGQPQFFQQQLVLQRSSLPASTPDNFSKQPPQITVCQIANLPTPIAQGNSFWKLRSVWPCWCTQPTQTLSCTLPGPSKFQLSCYFVQQPPSPWFTEFNTAALPLTLIAQFLETSVCLMNIPGYYHLPIPLRALPCQFYWQDLKTWACWCRSWGAQIWTATSRDSVTKVLTADSDTQCWSWTKKNYVCQHKYFQFSFVISISLRSILVYLCQCDTAACPGFLLFCFRPVGA